MNAEETRIKVFWPNATSPMERLANNGIEELKLKALMHEGVMGVLHEDPTAKVVFTTNNGWLHTEIMREGNND